MSTEPRRCPAGLDFQPALSCCGRAGSAASFDGFEPGHLDVRPGGRVSCPQVVRERTAHAQVSQIVAHDHRSQHRIVRQRFGVGSGRSQKLARARRIASA